MIAGAGRNRDFERAPLKGFAVELTTLKQRQFTEANIAVARFAHFLLETPSDPLAFGRRWKGKRNTQAGAARVRSNQHRVRAGDARVHPPKRGRLLQRRRNFRH